MSTLTLESLGLTKEEIIERVVARVAETLLTTAVGDEDDVSMTPTRFAKRLETKMLARVDAAVAEIAGKHVRPNVAAYIETLCLQATNQWGEKRGSPITFVEYLIAKADAFLREEVNYQGKVRGEDSYSWKSSGTRIAWMVHEHLQYSIQQAMTAALATANASIVGGLNEAIKIKLAEVAASLKVTTKIGA